MLNPYIAVVVARSLAQVLHPDADDRAIRVAAEQAARVARTAAARSTAEVRGELVDSTEGSSGVRTPVCRAHLQRAALRKWRALMAEE